MHSSLRGVLPRWRFRKDAETIVGQSHGCSRFLLDELVMGWWVDKRKFDNKTCAVFAVRTILYPHPASM
jgi:hypothetical protein